MKKKKVIVPMMIIDDSQYKDEPINRNPNSTLIKMRLIGQKVCVKTLITLDICSDPKKLDFYFRAT